MVFRQLLFSLIFVSALGQIHAQDFYQGFVAGVFPFKLQLDQHGGTGSYQVAGSSQKIRLKGGCEDDSCKYSGIDSAFVLKFQRNQDQLRGTISLADGRIRNWQATQTTADVELPTACDEGKWLRRWDTQNSEYVLTLAALPDQRVAGVLYVSSLNTTLRLSGEWEEQHFALNIKDSDGKVIGSLSANALLPLSENGGLVADMELEGNQQKMAFEATKSLPMGCLSAAGKIDLVYPLTQNVRGDTELGEDVNSWWQSLSKGNLKEASGWFVPSRLDDHLLSGWLYFSGNTDLKATAINIDLKSGKTINNSSLLGPRKGRAALKSESLARAIARHPLKSEPGFKKWVNDQELKELAIVEEGVVFGSTFHPVYGQLVWIETWAMLPNSKRLPSWVIKS